MKNLLFFSIIFILSCGSTPEFDDESFEELEQIELFSGQVSENFYPTYNKKLFITDTDGQIIASTPLINNESFTIDTSFDINNDQYDATFFFENTSNTGQNYILHTFVDVQPYQIELALLGLAPNFVGQASHHLNTTDILGDFLGNTYGSHSYSNGYYTVKTDLIEPTENFYLTFKNYTENSHRYIWKENITDQTNDTLDLSSTMEIESPISISYPENEYLSSIILGYVNGNLQEEFGLAWITEEDGAVQLDHYIPENIFSNYRIFTTIDYGFASLVKLENTNTIPLTQSFTSFNVDIINELYNLEMNFSDNADFFSTYSTYSIPFSNQNKIKWNVYGRSSNKLEYNFPNLIDLMIPEIPELTSDSLRLYSVELFNYSELLPYENFITRHLNNDFYFNEFQDNIGIEESYFFRVE